MNFQQFGIICLVLATVESSAAARTRCGRARDNSRIRCIKSNYGEDAVTLRQIDDTVSGTIEFDVSVYESTCGQPATGGYGERVTLNEHFTIKLKSVGPGKCLEVFVFDCSVNKEPQICSDLLKAIPE